MRGWGSFAILSSNMSGASNAVNVVISFEGMMRICILSASEAADLYKQVPVPNRMPQNGADKGPKKSGTKKHRSN